MAKPRCLFITRKRHGLSPCGARHLDFVEVLVFLKEVLQWVYIYCFFLGGGCMGLLSLGCFALVCIFVVDLLLVFCLFACMNESEV